jgi:signal peptidase II
MAKIVRIAIRRLCFIFILLSSTVGCDQVTKAIARDTLSAVGPLTYFDRTVVLSHAENPGVFLSLGAGLHEDLRFILFTLAVGLFLTGLFVILIRKEKMDKWTTTAMTLLLAGGIGNLIDRVAHGTVTDFINLGIGNLRTGIFNIADVAIVVGALILAIRSSKSKKIVHTA